MVLTKSFQAVLKDLLKSKQDVLTYLNCCLQDEDPRTFLMGLKDVSDFFGGISKISETTRLNRESLYRALSKKGNPQFTTVEAILDALGLEFKVARKKGIKKAS